MTPPAEGEAWITACTKEGTDRHAAVVHARPGGKVYILPSRRLCLDCGLEEMSDGARRFKVLDNGHTHVGQEQMRRLRAEVLRKFGCIRVLDSRTSWPPRA
jgi:hypothetical protein